MILHCDRVNKTILFLTVAAGSFHYFLCRQSWDLSFIKKTHTHPQRCVCSQLLLLEGRRRSVSRLSLNSRTSSTSSLLLSACCCWRHPGWQRLCWPPQGDSGCCLWMGGGHSTHMYEPSPCPGWVALSGGSDTKWHRQIFCCAFIPFERIFQQLPPSDRVANNIHDSLSFECNMNADYTVKLKLN